MELLWDQTAWASFVTLAFLEIVLGVDNIVFVSILAQRLPHAQQARARQLGIVCALVFRMLMLLSIRWIMGLTQTAMTVLGRDLSWKDLVLIVGGAFLLGKGGWEIRTQLTRASEKTGASVSTFGAVVMQIAIVDVVFSLDSIVTAVGMTPHVPVMVAAVLVAIFVMMISAKPISDFIVRNPTTKMLAIAFLVLIGLTLVVEGAGLHFPKGYLYSAIGFALVVEVLNLLQRRRHNASQEPLQNATRSELQHQTST